jgi:hypothetical protein
VFDVVLKRRIRGSFYVSLKVSELIQTEIDEIFTGFARGQGCVQGRKVDSPGGWQKCLLSNLQSLFNVIPAVHQCLLRLLKSNLTMKILGLFWDSGMCKFFFSKRKKNYT